MQQNDLLIRNRLEKILFDYHATAIAWTETTKLKIVVAVVKWEQELPCYSLSWIDLEEESTFSIFKSRFMKKEKALQQLALLCEKYQLKSES